MYSLLQAMPGVLYRLPGLCPELPLLKVSSVLMQLMQNQCVPGRAQFCEVAMDTQDVAEAMAGQGYLIRDPESLLFAVSDLGVRAVVPYIQLHKPVPVASCLREVGVPWKDRTC